MRRWAGGGKPAPSPGGPRGARHAGSRCCGPRGPTATSSSAELRGSGARLLCGGGLRRAPAATACSRCPARLGQPALLHCCPRGGVPGARCRPPSPRGTPCRDHDIPDRPSLDSGPATASSPRRSVRPIPPADLLERLAKSGCRAAVDHTRRHRRRHAHGGALDRSTGITVAPEVSVEQARVRCDLPAHGRRSAHPCRHSQPGCVDGDRGPAGQARARSRVGPSTPTDRDPLAPGAIHVDRPASGRHRSASRCYSARFSRPARSTCTPPIGPAAPGSTRAHASNDAATEPGRTQGPRRKPFDPARGAAVDVLRAVSARDPYANLSLPAMLRDASITGRDAAFATELTYRAPAAPGPARRGHRHAATGGRRTRSIRYCSTCYGSARTNCCASGSRARRGVHHGGAGRDRIRFDACGFRQRRVAHHIGRDEASWVAELAPSARHRSGRPHRLRPRAPTLDRPGLRRRAGAGAGQLDACSAKRRRTAAGALGGRAGGGTHRRGARHGGARRPSGATRRMPSTSPAVTPVSSRRSATGMLWSRRGQPLGGAGAHAGTGRGDTGRWLDLSPGRAARPRCWPRSGGAGGAGDRGRADATSGGMVARTPPGAGGGGAGRRPADSGLPAASFDRVLVERPAPASAHCAVGPRRAGGVRPTSPP